MESVNNFQINRELRLTSLQSRTGNNNVVQPVKLYWSNHPAGKLMWRKSNAPPIITNNSALSVEWTGSTGTERLSVHTGTCNHALKELQHGGGRCSRSTRMLQAPVCFPVSLRPQLLLLSSCLHRTRWCTLQMLYSAADAIIMDIISGRLL